MADEERVADLVKHACSGKITASDRTEKSVRGGDNRRINNLTTAGDVPVGRNSLFELFPTITALFENRKKKDIKAGEVPKKELKNSRRKTAMRWTKSTAGATSGIKRR